MDFGFENNDHDGDEKHGHRYYRCADQGEDALWRLRVGIAKIFFLRYTLPQTLFHKRANKTDNIRM
jgi:hypothetical protein